MLQYEADLKKRRYFGDIPETLVWCYSRRCINGLLKLPILAVLLEVCDFYNTFSAYWQRSDSGCHQVLECLMVTFSTNHATRYHVHKWKEKGNGKLCGVSATII